jgi:hypothetical protein
LTSSSSACTSIFRMPFWLPAKRTTPSISVMVACSFGFRASKSSATRGKTAGDVLGLGRLPRDLRDDVTRGDNRAVGHHHVRLDRQGVAADGAVGLDRSLGALALDGLDRHPRLPQPALILDDDLAGEAGDLVDLVVDRHALLDVR